MAKFSYQRNDFNWDTSAQRRKRARIRVFYKEYTGERAFLSVYFSPGCSLIGATNVQKDDMVSRYMHESVLYEV
jgi:hypothetical protein